MRKILSLAALSLCLATPALAHEHDDMEGDKSDALFDMIDTNHNGKISRAEWDAHSRKKFAEIDADHNGYITRSEWHRFKQKEWEDWKKKYPSAGMERHGSESDENDNGTDEHR